MLAAASTATSTIAANGIRAAPAGLPPVRPLTGAVRLASPPRRRSLIEIARITDTRRLGRARTPAVRRFEALRPTPRQARESTLEIEAVTILMAKSP
jgi:hypothetical protein